MLLIIGFSLVAFLAWVSTTDTWSRYGDMILGYGIAIVVIVHIVGFVLSLFGFNTFSDWTYP